jgi:hypothetical protein
MPALLTHHLFGEAMLARLGSAVFPVTDEYDPFLLGTQGPDPFFYPVFTTQLVALRRFGSRLHREHINSAFDALRAYVRRLPATEQPLLNAYLCGYLCHFALDRTAHPFVFAWQYALCDAGVPGLSREAGGYVHAQIEADLDAMMLYQIKAMTIEDYRLPKLTLQASDAVLEAVDGLYASVAAEVYGLRLVPHAFGKSVRDMRLSVSVLYSPRGIKRRLLGAIERIAQPHSLAQAMSHRFDIRKTCDFDNCGADPWLDPATGETSRESFRDLFEKAQDTAAEMLRLHEEGADTALITGNRSFAGIPLLSPLP